MATRFSDPMKCGIYTITAPSGNQYVGSSLNTDRRWYEHQRDFQRNEHANSALQNAWDKYKDQLEFKQILICRPEDLLMYEQTVLDAYQPEYNICKIAGNTLGYKLSEEHKARISWSGKKHSPETKEKMRQAQLGRKKTPEHVAKMANSKRGKPTKPCSEERKRKIGEANKLRWQERKAKAA